MENYEVKKTAKSKARKMFTFTIRFLISAVLSVAGTLLLLFGYCNGMGFIEILMQIGGYSSVIIGAIISPFRLFKEENRPDKPRDKLTTKMMFHNRTYPGWDECCVIAKKQK